MINFMMPFLIEVCEYSLNIIIQVVKQKWIRQKSKSEVISQKKYDVILIPAVIAKEKRLKQSQHSKNIT